MNGIPVGYWEQARDGERLQYFDAWLEDEQGRPLSLSLPFTPGNQPYRGSAVSAFFDNLLPDSEGIRRRLAQRHHAMSADPFGLLAKLGRDCVGAIQLLPEGEAPTDLFEINGSPLSVAEIAQLLRDTTTMPVLGHHDHNENLRLSIAGAQEKSALLRHRGQWLLPEGSTPTTHIFKLPMGVVGNMRADLRTSVENEWLCSRIVAAYGIPIASCEIARFENQKALIVDRFDRKLSSDARWIIRLPQEDMCQATGTPPTIKYQSDGGPGVARIMDILRGSDNTQEDRLNFFKTQIVFWLLAATDGHAKNFSIAHLPGSRYRATPIYDVLSAHPIIGTGKNRIARQKAKMSMAIRGSTNHYLIDKILRRHWIAQAGQVDLGSDIASRLIEDILIATPGVIEKASRLLPSDFPIDVADAIFTGMVRQRDRLAAS